MIKYVKIQKLENKSKKYKAIFYDENKKKVKTTSFGASGYDDYTVHKNEERKQLYLNRHRKNEDWKDYTSAGSLAMFILWNKKTIDDSIQDYLRRFKLKQLV